MRDISAQVVPLRRAGVRHVLLHCQGRELGIHEIQLVPDERSYAA